MKQPVQISSFGMAQFYCKRDWCFICGCVSAQIHILSALSTSRKQQTWCNNSLDNTSCHNILMLFRVLTPWGNRIKKHLMHNWRGEADFGIIRLLQCVSWQIQQSLSSLAANIKATSEELDVIFHPSFKQPKLKNSYVTYVLSNL